MEIVAIIHPLIIVYVNMCTLYLPKANLLVKSCKMIYTTTLESHINHIIKSNNYC